MKKLLVLSFIVSFFFGVLNAQDGFINAAFIEIDDWFSSYVSSSLIKIQNILKDISNRNFNTVVLIIKKESFVIYPSSYFPFYQIKNKKISEVDYLAYSITKAKENNLKVFAWIDVLKVSTQTFKNKDWFCITEDGKITNFLSCGNLEVQQFIVDYIKEIVNKYEVDGVILDNIMYPSQDTSYDEASKFRFYTRGNPKLLEYEDFQRKQLDKLICDIYSSIKLINSKILVSVVISKDYKNQYTLKGAYYENYQDFKLWFEKNYCDFFVIKGDEKTTAILSKLIPKDKIVLFDTTLKTNQFLGQITKSISKMTFLQKPNFPEIETKSYILTGKVLDENKLPIEDAWISIFSNEENKKSDFVNTSKDGSFNFVLTSSKTVELIIEYPHCEKVILKDILVDKNTVVEPTLINGADEQKEKLFFRIISPKNFLKTNTNTLHILARTYPKYKVKIDYGTKTEAAQVFKTGIFVIDNYKLFSDTNTLQILISDEFKTSTYTFTIELIQQEEVRKKESDEQKEFLLIQPEQKEYLLFGGDILEIKIKAPKGKKIYASFLENNEKIFMDEIEEGIYYKKYLVPDNFFSSKTKLVFEYEEVQKKFIFKNIYKKVYETDCFIEIWNNAYPLVGEVITNNASLNYGLHLTRLGGPYITELPKWTKLVIIGEKDEYYKVRLTKNLSGWIEKNNIKLNKSKTNILPKNYFTSISINTTKNYDYITFPFLEKVPYSINSVVIEDKNYIYLDIYYTHFATTWITNKPNTKIIENIRFEQLEDDHLRAIVILRTHNWGFWTEYKGKNLVLYVKSPPTIDKNNPLKNLKIGIEPGHGGDTNTGAISLSGMKEKNINLKFSFLLKTFLEKEKTTVVFLREGDTDPSFQQRLQKAYDENVDLIISVHCNAADTQKGYLSSAAGPSVYYKNENCKKLAENIHKNLTAIWKKDFGLVSNFNYVVVRQSRIPTILVELGFLTHPEDEEKLLDKNFNIKQAQAIIEGIKNFLSSIK